MKLSGKSLFVASTRQHVGKTTLSLGLLSGFKRRLESVTYMKPVGQEHVLVGDSIRVDKDALLFKEHFHLKAPIEVMSPVLIPQGFTRDFLDGKIKTQSLIDQIESAYHTLSKEKTFCIIEGTGHCGVGSLIDLNNAQVASLLLSPVLLVASGGLGSSFDELMLNKMLCDHYNLPILGIVLNRVVPEKQEMIEHYMKKALSKWDLPLLGTIPFDPLLSHPTMKEFEVLFKTSLISGEQHRFRRFQHIRLVATSVETYREWIIPNQLLITPANREDIILATLSKHWEEKDKNGFDGGMILTGDYPPRHYILEEIQKAQIPMLYVPLHSHTVMQQIDSFTAKIQKEDTEKVKEAICVVEDHVDFERLEYQLLKVAKS